MIRRLGQLTGYLALIGLLGAPASADWLVLRDGSRLETDGPWRVKGRQVVFTRPGGALAALRLADVDIEASTQATASAAQPAEPEPAPPPPPVRRQRPSVLVLTNDDLRPSGNGGADFEDSTAGDLEGAEEATEGEDADDEAEDSEPQGSSEPVEIISWREVESSTIDGLEIVGSVRNRGQDVAADIRVQVQIPDEDGGLLADARAFLDRSSLAPGRSTTFRALLTGIYNLPEEPTFQVNSERFTLQLVQETQDDDESDEFADPADGLADDSQVNFPDGLESYPEDDPDELGSDPDGFEGEFAGEDEFEDEFTGEDEFDYGDPGAPEDDPEGGR